MVRDWLMVQDDAVVNAVRWDPDGTGSLDWNPPEGTEMIARDDAPGVDIGWVRIEGAWTDPNA